MLSIYAAFLADFLIGDPASWPHPVRLIGAYISFFEKHAIKASKSEPALKAAGVLLLITTVGLAFLSSWYTLKLAGWISPYLYHVLNILLLYTCIAARCLSDEGRRIYLALKEEGLDKGRKLLSMVVGRDTDSLNESGVTRGAVETIAENTSDGVIAPLFYMFIGGAPLAMAYKAVNTLDSMIGYKNERYLHFGRAAALFDDAANYIPARITGILIVLASLLMGLDYKSSLRTLLRDSRNHSSPNSGFPESAVAGALGVQLGGTNHYFGKPVEKPTIGDPLRPLVRKDIKTAIGLMYISSILALILFSIVLNQEGWR
ncbi:MAG TPA: adenosylcobinamide-phosphate synthase CbiB [Clostridia bacterium]|nr:adenosylcobinamide-phosphate synthase CbiB [Clostridia bacterium]